MTPRIPICTLLMRACIALIFSTPAMAQLFTAPAPAGIPASPHYRVEASQGGRAQNIHVYITEAQVPQFNRSRDTSWAQFSFSESVTLRITKLTPGSFKDIRVLPTSAGIKATRTDQPNTITLTLDRPRQLSIEFDGDITHPLLVFAQPLEENVPARDASGVVYFGPGLHDLGPDGLELKSNQTIYLADGAFVNGRIHGHNVTHASIRGRGILCGRRHGKGPHHLHFTGENSSDITIEGITLVDAPAYFIVSRAARTRVDRINTIGWWFNTDGVAAGPDSVVENCFFKVNDDAIKLYSQNLRVSGCTIWQMENGSPFQISWNSRDDVSGVRVSDCDVIRCDHNWDNPNEAIFASIHGGAGHLTDYVLENIRIENASWRLFNLEIRRNQFAKSPTLGSIRNLTFKNISWTSSDGQPPRRLALFQGDSAESAISDITIENLSLDGETITDANASAFFELEPTTTRNIRFKNSRQSGSPKFPDAKCPMPDYKILAPDSPITSGLNSYGQRDFHLLRYIDAYFLVATEAPNPEWGKRGIILYRADSDELRTWREHRYLINRKSIAPDAWYRDVWHAPELHALDGKFYLTFACRNDSTNPYGQLGLGLAVADAIDGPYQILTTTAPLALGNNLSLFRDTEGSTHALWDHDARIWTAPIDLASAKLTAAPRLLFPTQPHRSGAFRHHDGPHLFLHNKTYYLFYSQFSGGFNLNYATAPSLTGPWTTRADNQKPFFRWDEDDADTRLKMPYSDGWMGFAPPTEMIGNAQIFALPDGRHLFVHHSPDKYSEPYLQLNPIAFAPDGTATLQKGAPDSRPAQPSRNPPAPPPSAPSLAPHASPLTPLLTPYPAPPTLALSPHYRVEAIIDNKPIGIPTIHLDAQQPETNLARTTAFAGFAQHAPVTLRVTRLTPPGVANSATPLPPITYCAILPSARKITPRIIGPDTIEFDLPSPAHLSVEFERGKTITHPLLILADPPEDPALPTSGPNVIRFEPGLHDLKERLIVRSGQTLYFAPGSLVRGQILLENADHVTLHGRGILSGELYPARSAHHMIQGQDSSHVLIDGLTMINAPRYNIALYGGAHHTVRHVKMLGWWFSTDGVATSTDALVEHCFFKVNDDALKLYDSRTIVRHCTIWQMENGAPFMLSWNISSDNSAFHVHDIDILRCEHRWDNPNLALITAIHGSAGHMSDYLFENLRIENSDTRLLHLVTRPNRFAAWHPERGRLSHITLRNVTLDRPQHLRSLIKGHDAQHPVTDILLENIRIGDPPFTAADAIIAPATTSNIVISP